MARTAKEGGLVTICQKHGITDTQLFDFVGGDIKSRTLWDWTKTKPTALEVLIIGVAQQLSTVALTDPAGITHYIKNFELEEFLTKSVGEGWQISGEGVWDSSGNRVFTIKRLGNNPALVF